MPDHDEFSAVSRRTNRLRVEPQNTSRATAAATPRPAGVSTNSSIAAYPLVGDGFPVGHRVLACELLFHPLGHPVDDRQRALAQLGVMSASPTA